MSEELRQQGQLLLMVLFSFSAIDCWRVGADWAAVVLVLSVPCSVYECVVGIEHLSGFVADLSAKPKKTHSLRFRGGEP